MKELNKVEMAGRLYNYALKETETKNGDEAIIGTITLEVSGDGDLVTFSVFARPTYNNGKKNPNFAILSDMLEGNYATASEDGGEEAEWFRASGSIDISYYEGRNPATDPSELARSQKYRLAFLNPNRTKEYQNRWKADVLLTRVIEIEADEEKGVPRRAELRGYLIDSYNEMVREFGCESRSDKAIDFLTSLNCTDAEPYYTMMWGQQKTIVNKTVMQGAFSDGDDEVHQTVISRTLITNMSSTPYEFGDEQILSVSKYEELKANLAAHKQDVFDNAGASSGEGETKKKLMF